ncbi:MAG: PQQ-like beta-propeller repeat protein [Planctomycetes bacterium]|nr:PQQ-like beta-propeller repeat protein [Planctomycetota bacterium]
MICERHRRLLLMSVLVVLLASCAGEDFGRPATERLLPTEEALRQLDMEEVWHCGIGYQPVRNVYLLDGLICLETEKRKLYAINTKTGVLQWQYQLDFCLEYPPCDNADGVYMLIGDRLYALEKQSGHVIWNRPLDFSPTAPPAANIGLVAVPGRHILNTVEALDGTLAWYIRLRGRMFGAPAALGDFFFVGDDTGWIYCINARIGEKIWQRETRGPIEAAPYPMADICYVGSTDYKVYALDPVTGFEKWETTTGSMVRKRPLGTADAVYAESYNNGVVALDAESGTMRWRDQEAERVLAVGTKRAYLLSKKPGVIRAVNARSGELEKRIHVGKYKFFPTNYTTDQLFLVNEKGLVVCLREKSEKTEAAAK